VRALECFVWPVLCMLGPAVLAEAAPEPSRAAPAPDPPRIRQTGPHLYQIGAVIIDAKERTVRCPGRVNMAEGGPIEVLACLPRGKTHESVLTVDVEPMDLQVALLLLDMKEGRNPAVRYPDGSPELKRLPGDDALIFVEWKMPAKEEGKEPQVQRCRAEELLYMAKEERAVTGAAWVFLGSTVASGRFGADLDGTLITTFHDPLAILELNLPLVNNNPYAGADLEYIVNKNHCPPVGTPVDLIIQVPPKAEPAQDANDKEKGNGGRTSDSPAAGASGGR